MSFLDKIRTFLTPLRPGQPKPPKGLLGEPLGPSGAPPSPEPPKDKILQWTVTSAPGVSTGTGWDVSRIAHVLRAHVHGNFHGSGILTDDIIADPIIAHALSVRQEAFTSLPRLCVPSSRGEAKRCADFIREAAPEFLSDQILRDIGKDYRLIGEAAVAIDWEERKDGKDVWWLPRLKPWHPSLLYHVFSRDLYSADASVLVATTLDRGNVVVEPGSGRWLLYQNGSRQPWLNGLVRALGEVYLGDIYNFRDNLANQEKYAQGVWKLFHPVEWKDQQISNSVSSIQNGGTSGVISCPETADGKRKVDVELLQTDASAYQTFDSTERRIIRRILLPLLGQDMTSVGGSGGYAQAVVHSEVLWHKREIDAAAFGDARLSTARDPKTGDLIKTWVPYSGELRRQLLSWIAYFNFGDFNLAPYYYWDATPPEDIIAREKARAEQGKERASAIATLAGALEKLAPHVQGKIDVAAMMEQCGVELHLLPEDR